MASTNSFRMATSYSDTFRLPALSSLSLHRMSSTRHTLVIFTAWYSYPPPAKARRALHKRTSFSLLGAAMRPSRCVWLECAASLLERGEHIRSGSALPTGWNSSLLSSVLTAPFSPSSRGRISYMQVARTDTYAFGTCRPRRSSGRSLFRR